MSLISFVARFNAISRSFNPTSYLVSMFWPGLHCAPTGMVEMIRLITKASVSLHLVNTQYHLVTSHSSQTVIWHSENSRRRSRKSGTLTSLRIWSDGCIKGERRVKIARWRWITYVNNENKYTVIVGKFANIGGCQLLRIQPNESIQELRPFLPWAYTYSYINATNVF